MSIRRTDYLQPIDKMRTTVPIRWWVALAWFTGVALVTLTYLLALILSPSPLAPRDQGQESPPQSAGASVLSPLSAAERKIAAGAVTRSKEREPASLARPPAPSPTPSPDPRPAQPPSDWWGVGLPPLLVTIRAHESGGNYQAVNPSGCEGYGCFGAYQMHGLYADDWARRYGAAQWATVPPSQWPAEVQDHVALKLFWSTSPAGAHWCAWTDYC